MKATVERAERSCLDAFLAFQVEICPQPIASHAAR
jgi:hypothetical protein